MGDDDARNNIGHIFLPYFRELQVFSYAIIGSHPVELYTHSVKSILFRDRGSAVDFLSLKRKQRRAVPCIAKQDSNMKQLELQFEGFADECKPVDVNLDATKQRVIEIANKAKTIAIISVQATAAVAFCFGVLFISAIFGG